MTPQTTPPAMIIVLNYNGRNHLEYCLPSLFATEYPNYELMVVDNGSSDDSVSLVRQHFPQVEILCNPTNLGWSGGNNKGIRLAQQKGAAYIALMNNDIKVDPRWLREAIRVAERDPRIGMVGFDIIEMGRSRGEKSFVQAKRNWTEVQVRPTDNIQGSALLVRTQVFDDIGLIDEGFFAYGEENDLEYRAMMAGYKLVAINVPIWHYSEGAWKRRPVRATFLAIRHQIRFAIKNLPPADAVRNILGLVNVACNPFINVDTTKPSMQRLRPFNVLFNSVLVLLSLVWNLWNLPSTLLGRQKDHRAALQARERWEQ